MVKKEHNYGIDLLRIVSMFMVIVLHVYGQGGALENNNVISWFTYIMMYCAVDCYALITGFVSYSDSIKEYKYTRYIELWMQVVFYGVLTVFALKIPYVSKRLDIVISGKDFLKVCLPLTSRQYWYFSAYTVLVFVKPWLDNIVRNLNRKNAIRFIVMLFGVLFVHLLLGNFGFSIYEFKGGYSCTWLIVLYLLGACICKFELYNKVSKIQAILWYFVFVIITWVSKYAIRNFTNLVVGTSFWENTLVQYISPTILGSAVCLLAFFSQLKCGKNMKRIIAFITPAIFGVYLLHVQPIVFEQIFQDKFLWITKLPDIVIPSIVFGVSIAILILGILVDKCRAYLFKILKLKTLATKIDLFIRKNLEVAVKFIDDNL